MANQDAAFGLSPQSTLTGGDYRNLQVLGYLPAAYATAVFVGTPVKLAGDANDALVTGFTGGDIKAGQATEVTLSAAGESIDYVITSFLVDASTENSETFRGAALTERLVQMVPVNDVIFTIQSSGTGAVTDIGSVADITAEAGSTTTGFSTVELDSGTVATGSSAQLTILGVSFDMENDDISSANVNLRVRVNESNLTAGSDGV